VDDGLIALPVGQIERAIIMVRGERVILDLDLALLYGVTAKRLREQVRRNMDRFPPDFLIRLRRLELREVAAICGNLAQVKYSPALPYAFTEHGAIMAATVLNSPRAVQMSVFIVRAFVRMRQMLAQNAEIAARLAELEAKVGRHDEQIATIIEAIHQLMAPPPEPKRTLIGFQSEGRP